MQPAHWCVQSTCERSVWLCVVCGSDRCISLVVLDPGVCIASVVRAHTVSGKVAMHPWLELAASKQPLHWYLSLSLSMNWFDWFTYT